MRGALESDTADLWDVVTKMRSAGECSWLQSGQLPVETFVLLRFFHFAEARKSIIREDTEVWSPTVRHLLPAESLRS